MRLEGKTVWLTLSQMAKLFDRSVISRHLANIFSSGELKHGATVAENATAQQEGDREAPQIDGLATMNSITAALYDSGGAEDVFAPTITRTRSHQ